MTQHDTRPAAGGTSLVPLRSLPEVRFAEGEPDVRGWDVLASDGGRVGVVEELLVDAATHEVAALAVSSAWAPGELALVPMPTVRIDDRARAVLADLTREQFHAIPRSGAPATGVPAAGTAASGVAATGAAATAAAPPVVPAAGSRTVAAEPVAPVASAAAPAAVSGTVVPPAAPRNATPATTAAGAVDLAAGHPGVTVERTASGEEIVRIPIVEEELVIERRPVVKEMLVIRKRVVQEERVVEADLRRERIEVDRRDADG
jgi:hypothetical protein